MARRKSQHPYSKAMSRAERANLAALCKALLGETPQQPDWNAILALANRTLVTPALATSLREREAIPGEVREFLQHIAERSRMRNETMRSQLGEAVAALARTGQTPILLKGAGMLADPSAPLDQRLFADLDLLLPRIGAEQAVAALSEAGFSPYASSVAIEDGINLKRDIDAGGLDIHFRLRALPGAPGCDEMLDFTVSATIGGNRVLTLTPTAQAAVLIAHDQIQERDYWRGLIDLRHLYDLHVIASRHGAADAEAMHRLFPTRASRRAMETQLLTAHRFFGTPLPHNWRPTLRARLQAARREWQLSRPIAMPLLTATSLLCDLPALASPLAALSDWRHRARYLRRMFEPRKDTKA